jgi:hypothetical protein
MQPSQTIKTLASSRITLPLRKRFHPFPSSARPSGLPFAVSSVISHAESMYTVARLIHPCSRSDCWMALNPLAWRLNLPHPATPRTRSGSSSLKLRQPSLEQAIHSQVSSCLSSSHSLACLRDNLGGHSGRHTHCAHHSPQIE